MNVCELYAELEDSASSHFVVQSSGLELHERDFPMFRRYKVVMREDKIFDSKHVLS